MPPISSRTRSYMRLDLVLVGDVALDREIALGLGAEVHADDPRALGHEPPRGLGADAARGAGDHADLAVEPCPSAISSSVL